MPTYRDMVPYGPPSYFSAHEEPLRLKKVNHSDQLKEKKLSLVEFKIEKLQLEENNGSQEKIKYYDEKYNSVRSALLDVEFKQDTFVAHVDDEKSIEKLQKLKLAIIENKSCNLL